MASFQEMIQQLSVFWAKHGCAIHQGYDLELGAGTSNPATFLRSLGPEPYCAAYVEPSRRPKDGRYGQNPNRTQHYFQYQVILKPSPLNIQDLYIQSLEAIGFKLSEHDIRFVHDDWENPTLGAWGLGWEVWIDGMEITQFTYFQAIGGIPLKPVTGEITYGLERLALYLQNKDTFFDLQWNDTLTYGDIYQRNEVEWSHYNFEEADSSMWFRHFDDYEKEAKRLIEKKLPIPGYDFVLKASHAFNILDARGVISVTERTGYIGRIRDLASLIAQAYLKSREEQGFPLLRTKQKNNLPETPKLKVPTSDPTKTQDLLLEIGSEDLPATFVSIGVRHLEQAVAKLLDKEHLSYEKISVYGTPRRLAIHVHSLSAGKAPHRVERKGPSIDRIYDEKGVLSAVGTGFFQSIGIKVPSLKELQEGKCTNCEIRDIKGNAYLFANIEEPGLNTLELLARELPSLMLSLDFPKKMRWSDLDITYARPIRWIVALFGELIIPFELGGIVSSNLSSGHRQLAPRSIPITSAKTYLTQLRTHFVIADIEERKQLILTSLEILARGHQVLERDKVLAQVLHLVEYPQLTIASFDDHFLEAPQEVLISEMVEHQKYFPIADLQGKLENLFIITANNTPSDKIRKGNQKVLSARLSDGVFLYKQDLKSSLSSFNEKLKMVTFQKDLGSVFAKVERIVGNVDVLQEFLSITHPEKARRAALLCKADLASELVGEFPELQGTIGKYYALAQGEDPHVATAIDEHWMPRGEKAPLPGTEEGSIVSLADKIDNLIACFSVGLKPSSSSDPYALRRQVLGMIKMLIANKYHIPLREVLEKCCRAFPAGASSSIGEILTFITNRIKTIFLDYGFSKEDIEASLTSDISDVYASFCKVQALQTFKTSNSHFPLLVEVYKRAKGQLQNQKPQHFSDSLLQEDAEKILNKAICNIETPFTKAMTSYDYQKAYSLIASLQPPLARLFEEVLILCEDEALKNNRIALLQRVFSLFSQLLDFNKVKI